MEVADVIELRIDKVVAGGDGLARDGDGRVVFVSGALPGELVSAEITEVRSDLARAVVSEVLSRSDLRVEPPCPNMALGCGGCDWQHVDGSAQIALKVALVRDALSRIARLGDAQVYAAPDRVSPDVSRGRTTVRLAVYSDGRAAYRRRASHQLVAVDECLVLHPALDDMMRLVRVPGASEVMMRVSDATGERALTPIGRTRRSTIPDGVSVGLDAVVHERVGGVLFGASLGSFFQSSRHAAELLVDVVGRAIAGVEPDHVVDAYGGVGLFAGALAGRLPGARWTVIESNASAARDAKSNLSAYDARVVTAEVSRWKPTPAGLVIADPARPGLGRNAASTLVATGAERIVLVSCDAASMARDTGLLIGHGYSLDHAAVLSVFPYTSHVEIVSTFTR